MNQITVKQLPKMNLAHCKIVGRFEEIGKAYNQLMTWAGAKGILNDPNAQVLTVYHSEPIKDKPNEVEQSACVSIPENIELSDGIEKMIFPGGKYAIGRFEITSNGFEHAWSTVCSWVEQNGYNYDKGLSCELYHNDHNQHPEKKHIVDICVPVI